MDKKGPSYAADVNADWYSRMQNSMDVPLKKIVIIWSSNTTPGHIAQDNSNLKRYMCPNAHGNTIYNSQNVEAT